MDRTADLDDLIWYPNTDVLEVSAAQPLKSALDEARSSLPEWIVLVGKQPESDETIFYAFRWAELETFVTNDPANLGRSAEEAMDMYDWTCSGVTRNRSLVGDWSSISGPAARRVVDLDISGKIWGIGEITDPAALCGDESDFFPGDFDDLLGFQRSGRTAPAKEEPKNAYALLDCPDDVEPMSEFVVTIGLAEHPTPGVAGGPLHLPSVGYRLTVTLAFDGFLLRSGEVNQLVLDVTEEEPYPKKELHLTAVAGEKYKSARTLQAVYSVEGEYIGAASRAIIVRDQTVPASNAHPVKGFDLSMPPGVPVPDMTISITKGNTVSGDRLLWNVLSPHQGIDTRRPEDEDDYKSDIGSEPEKWARDLMNSVNGYRAEKDLRPMMVGNGKEIRWKIPVWVRRKLRDLSALFSDPEEPRPSLFIVSDEPHIPWELAYLKLDLPGHLPGQSEDFLGSAFAVGRWVHGAEDVDGHRVPPYPPPTEVLVGNMAVVSGHYNTKYWNALEGAEQEAGELVASYHAVPVNADGDLATWLSQQGATDAIHFAVHGKWSASGGQDGIILVDGTALTSKEIRGITLTNKPFVFLNACQLGQGEKILGDYGGIAKAFLDAGAAGVVAALWNVDDKEAKKLALGFYEQAKSTQVCPAEIFRKLRSSFEKDMHSKLALAYQYFGHPQMRMMLNLP